MLTTSLVAAIIYFLGGVSTWRYLRHSRKPFVLKLALQFIWPIGMWFVKVDSLINDKYKPDDLSDPDDPLDNYYESFGFDI